VADVISVPEPFTKPLDHMGRPVLSDLDKRRLDALWTTIPDGKRGAVVVIADEQGARGHVAAKIDGTWKVGAGGGWRFGEKRPHGYIGVEGSW
jgi:hypothetical protein